jgi:hypothetical protein
VRTHPVETREHGLNAYATLVSTGFQIVLKWMLKSCIRIL